MAGLLWVLVVVRDEANLRQVGTIRFQAALFLHCETLYFSLQARFRGRKSRAE